jgi:hypothetical protein
MDLNADEFPVLDTLPRVFAPQAAPDALTQQLSPGAREIITRPLLADEYPHHTAAPLYNRTMWGSWRLGGLMVLGALVFQIVALVIIERFLYSLVPPTVPRYPMRPTTSYEWLHILPYGLLVLAAVGIWRKSRAAAVGLLLSILIAFCALMVMPTY